MKCQNKIFFLFTIFFGITSLNLINFTHAQGLINTFTFDVGDYKNSSFESSIEVGLKLCYYDGQSVPHPVFPDKISIIITNLGNTQIMTRELNPDKIIMSNTIRSSQNIIKIQCNLEDIKYDIKLIVKVQSSQFTNNYLIQNYNSSKVVVEYLDSTEYDIFSFIIQLNYKNPNHSKLEDPLVFIAIALPVFFISACVVTVKVQKNSNHKGRKIKTLSTPDKDSDSTQSINNNKLNQQFEKQKPDVSYLPIIEMKESNSELKEVINGAETQRNDFLRSSKKIDYNNFQDMMKTVTPENLYQSFESNKIDLKIDDDEINENINQDDSDIKIIYLE